MDTQLDQLSLLPEDILYISLTIYFLYYLVFIVPTVQDIIMFFYKKNLDKANPRLFQSEIKEEAEAGNRVAKAIIRCRECQMNCWEDIIIWTGTVFLMYNFNIDRTAALVLTSTHFGARFLYCFAYVFIDSKTWSYIRTILNLIGFVSAMTLQLMAINNLRKNGFPFHKTDSVLIDKLTKPV